MNRNHSISGYGQSYHLDPSSLNFSMFSTSDIRQISVAKVITCSTFNAVGHAVPQGLYDPAMGPFSSRGDPCTTCAKTIDCTGHIGHIELANPVLNPMFIKPIYDVLRMSCLKCFKMQIRDQVQEIIILQLKLIDAGYLTEARELEYFKSELMIEKYKNNETSLLEEELKKANVLLASGPSHTNTTKNIESFRLTVIRSIFQINNIGTGRKMCKFCNVKINPIKYLYRRLVMAVREEILDEEHNTKRRKSDIARVTNKFLLPEECQRYLRNIYANNAEFLKSVIPVLQNASQTAECPIDVFFMEVIPVSPPIVRPANKLRNEILEHPQTSVYQNIILANSVVQAIITKMQVENGTEVDPKIMEESTKVFESTSGSSAHEKLFNARQELQQCVDQLLDSNAGKQKAIGLKQIIEKKEGIIRKHMMGKRVNFAARTVITPDPNINVDEIGFPEVFAKRLTYPVPVTPWNVEELRKRIINGPDNFPGANFIEDEQGRIKMIPANNEKRRIGMVKLLSASSKDGVQIVHRHLQDGDVIIFNRQPSLHRPSMMGHKIKVLRNEKTFRLHYSNCKSYNADFDGDEMNAHVPQNELARSEGYNLANVANQYLVPKDGTPLGGLIQDHVIAGVKLSVRGRFFNKEDYCQLVFSALDQSRKNIKFLPPAIIKPHRLWSGKQVLSTIIINSFPDNRAGINLTAGTKISDKAWQSSPPRKWKAGGTILIGNAMTEAEVVFRGGELMSGVLDKTHFGATPYSLIHCVYDLYGSNCSTNLLSAFSKLFTYFLKREGFTLGVRDILVDSKADRTRTEIIEESRMIGRSVLTTALDMPPDTTWKNVKKKFDHALATDPKLPTIMDRAYKSALDNFTNRINRTCLPSGLLCKFPENNLQLMVGSGAKGSTVNTMQISCLLGQIELEGKRPPLMISGKSLPSFIRMETSPKSGGFIDGRFMTGIQPQDFFFHCMAGREGLIDTAVKTSRSGYLQRCLIKHLEGLNINYDMTVRDSDNSVVQFLYGEDGLDIAKSQFLKKSQLKFLDDNSKVILNDQLMDQIESIADEDEYNDVKKYKKKLKKWHKSNGPLVTKHYSAFQKFCSDLKGTVDVKKPLKLNKDTGRMRIDTKLIELWQSADKDQLKTYAKQCVRKPDPINSKYKSDVYFGSISEHMEAMVEEYLMKNPDKRKSFSEVVNLKGMSALAPPGEPVGLLAAQSVGEPSTQMTLNTFHFAGRGEMNVTLGIPRLREILMVASSNIKTPTMDIPFRPQTNLTKNAEKLRLKLNKITLANVLETINVKTRLLFQPNRLREYTIRFNFLPHEAYEQDYAINPKKIIRYMKSTFHNVLYKAVIKLTSERYSVVDIEAEGKTKNKNQDDDAELDTREPDGKKKSKSTQDDSDEDDEDDDNDATNIKLKNKRNDENEYDEPEEDDGYEEDKMEESYDQDGEKHSESESDVEIKEEEESNENASSNFVSDTKNYLWCQFTFHLDMRHKTVDLSTFLRQLAEKTILRQVPRINKAITYMQDDELILKTEGTNIVEMFPFNKELDLNRLYTNDIQAIARTYGIEAAARAIVKEIQNVFKVYGIAVDPRHLLLIADYMTFDGSVKPMNRKAMETAASPLQQMSFESSLQFLKSATINGCSDKLESPSSCLMFGQPCKFGTGAFSVLMDIQKLLPQSN